MPDRHLWTRHSNKRITYTGAADAGATGVNTIFTITGRVWLHLVSAFCETLLVGGGAWELGVAADVDAFIAVTTDTDIDANEWWTSATPIAGAEGPLKPIASTVPSQMDMLLSQNIILTIATNPTTSGVMAFDVLYTPLTDGGRLF
jgi:hypothetical protein